MDLQQEHKYIRNSKQTPDEYLKELIFKLKDKANILEKLNNNFSWYRLGLFFLGVIISLLFFFFTSNLLTIISILFFLISFAILAHIHGKIIRGLNRLNAWIKIKETHCARINLDWKNIPNVIDQNLDNSPIEIDLDITGNKSLLQLIDFTVSIQGRSLLRSWLLNKAPNKNEIYERQKLVKELIPHSRLRDKMYLIKMMLNKNDFNGELVINWLKNFTPQKSIKKLLILLSILAPLNIILFILSLTINLPAYWAITLLFYIGIYYFGRDRRNNLFEEIEFLNDELKKFRSILTLLENYPYPGNSLIKNECNIFLDKNKLPSFLLKSIENSMSFLRLRKGNPFVWTLIRLLFPIDYFFTRKIDNYKEKLFKKLPAWLNTFYKIDALNSLANFAYLNPEYKFPDIVPGNSPGEKIFEAIEIGHPLIPHENKVFNNFQISSIGETAIITGSNMSGKSTFLRTLGINVCLAYSGGPVNARTLNLSLFRIFTCIKVSDSVIDGISYFYAEVKRLKQLLEIINEKNKLPLFFLIDEIFSGTNNIERLKGSKAFIKALSQANGLGVVATHDLELIKLEQEILNIKNYHFKEEIRNDKMVFDYKINPGPCPTTNALIIMKMEGLPVE